MRVAAKLGIPFLVWDFKKEYREDVFNYMVGEYAAGLTPNPDVMCNKDIKYGYGPAYFLKPIIRRLLRPPIICILVPRTFASQKTKLLGTAKAFRKQAGPSLFFQRKIAIKIKAISCGL